MFSISDQMFLRHPTLLFIREVAGDPAAVKDRRHVVIEVREIFPTVERDGTIYLDFGI